MFANELREKERVGVEVMLLRNSANQLKTFLLVETHLSLSADDGGLLVLNCLIHNELGALRILLSHLLGFNGSGVLLSEGELLGHPTPEYPYQMAALSLTNGWFVTS